MFRFRAFTIIIHIAGWLIFLSLPLLLLSRGESSNIPEILSSWSYFQFCLIFILLFYLNAFVLIPYLFIPKKYLLYFLSFVILMGIVIALKPFHQLMFNSRIKRFENMQMPPPSGFGQDFRPGQKYDEDRPTLMVIKGMQNDSVIKVMDRMPPPPGRFLTPMDSSSIFIFLMIMAISLAYRFIQQWESSEKRILSAEAEKANAELSFLKAQVNPHFLFNTLNNIYSLAVSGSKHTPDSILKLSNIMHFVTDEAGSDFIPLQKEIDFIRDYIDLQKLRLSKNTKVIFEINGTVSNQKISPLIFMPFIENTFKYGVSKNISSEIIIRILVKEDSISFYSLNSIFKLATLTERTGIGIQNTKKRLEYLYPGKHQLTIRDANELFIVNLIIHYT